MEPFDVKKVLSVEKCAPEKTSPGILCALIAAAYPADVSAQQLDHVEICLQKLLGESTYT